MTDPPASTAASAHECHLAHAGCVCDYCLAHHYDDNTANPDAGSHGSAAASARDQDDPEATERSP